MGAWVKDPVPGAAGARPGLSSNAPGRVPTWPPRRRAQGLSPMRPWAMASCSVLLYYYTLILYYHIILEFFYRELLFYTRENNFPPWKMISHYQLTG